MTNITNNSTAYRINFADNTQEQADDAYNMPLGDDVHVFDSFEHCTYLADFGDSGFVEGYLNSRGINFVKIPQSVVLSEENIINRSILPEDYQNDGKHSLVLLDTEKFEKYYQNDDFYLSYNCNDIQYKNVMKFLKSGEDFEVPQVDIYETNEGLNVSFEDGRHRYATLRELGLKRVPICLDKNSVKMAEKYGLIAA